VVDPRHEDFVESVKELKRVRGTGVAVEVILRAVTVQWAIQTHAYGGGAILLDVSQRCSGSNQPLRYYEARRED